MVVTLSVVGEGPDVNMSHMDVPRDAVSAARSLSTFHLRRGFLRWCIIPGYGVSTGFITDFAILSRQSKSFRMLPSVVSKSRLLLGSPVSLGRLAAACCSEVLPNSLNPYVRGLSSARG